MAARKNEPCGLGQPSNQKKLLQGLPLKVASAGRPAGTVAGRRAADWKNEELVKYNAVVIVFFIGVVGHLKGVVFVSSFIIQKTDGDNSLKTSGV